MYTVECALGISPVFRPLARCSSAVPPTVTPFERGQTAWGAPVIFATIRGVRSALQVEVAATGMADGTFRILDGGGHVVHEWPWVVRLASGERNSGRVPG